MADFFGHRLSCLDSQQGEFQGNPSPCWACPYEMISFHVRDKKTAPGLRIWQLIPEVSTRGE